MIAADGAFVALRHRCAAEFAAENDERVVEEAALFQIGDEGHAGAIDFLRTQRQFLAQEAVVVPIAMVELDEACAAFGESAGEQAVRREGAVAGCAAVEFERFRAFGTDVHQLRHAGLHLEGHFILRDACGDLGVVAEGGVLFVERIDRRHVRALSLARDAVWTGEIQNGIALRAELHALILRRQKAAAPLPRRNGLRRAAFAGGYHDDKARQILRLAAEPVGDPCAHARTARDLSACVHEHVRRVVVDRVRRHRAHEAEVVRHAAEMRQQLGKLHLALAVFCEAKHRSLAHQFLPLELRELLSLRERLRHRLPVHLRELWLVIKQLQLRRPARHREPDHAFRLLRQRQLAQHAACRCLKQIRTEQ